MQKGVQKEIVYFAIKFRISSPQVRPSADRGEDFEFRIYYERRNYDTTLHAS